MAFTEVILREKIVNLGVEAEVVKVRRGYARNCLIPQGKAYEATKGNLRHIEALQAARAKREAEELTAAEKLAGKIKKARITLELATGETGKAFGSITVNDLVQALEEKIGEKVDRHAIQLDKPIKNTGSFDIPMKLHPEVSVDLRFKVEAKGSDNEERGEVAEPSE